MDATFQALGFQPSQSSPPPVEAAPSDGSSSFASMGFQPAANQPTPATNPLGGIVPGIKSALGNGINAIKSDLSTNTTVQQSKVSPLQKIGSEVATGAGLAGDITSLPFEAIGGAVGAVIPQQIKQAAGTALQGTADAITNNPSALNALNTINNLVDAHPQVAELLKGLGTTALNVSGEGGAEGVAKAGTEAVGNVTDKIGDIIGPTEPPPPADLAAQHQVSLTKDWQAPSEINKSAYNNARKVLAKDPDAPTTLAKMGINPSAYISEGNFDTQELGQEIRQAAGDESSQQLRPALQLADHYTTPRPISEVQADAVSMVKKDRSLTRGAKRRVISNIQNETSAMSEEYPNGLTLTNSHDEKISYGLNSGFSPIKDPVADNLSTANRYLSSALQKDVELRAPASLPVHEVNADLTKAYRAADYVEALHTKKAPVTFAQTAARFGAKFGGATIARHVIGGDIISDFAGYQIGKYIESALENMSRPGRAQYLANLEKYEPDSFQALQDFISKNKSGNPEIPRLKAPVEPVSPLNNGLPISLPAESPSTIGTRETLKASTKKNIADAIERSQNGPKRLKAQNPIIIPIKPK